MGIVVRGGGLEISQQPSFQAFRCAQSIISSLATKVHTGHERSWGILSPLSQSPRWTSSHTFREFREFSWLDRVGDLVKDFDEFVHDYTAPGVVNENLFGTEELMSAVEQSGRTVSATVMYGQAD